VVKKIPVIGDILGGLGKAIQSLFGTKTKIVGNGIAADPQALGDVLSGGFDASTYADIQKKKKFLGMTTSTKYSTKYGALDDDIQNQFGLILKGFDQAISAAAGPLGLATSDVTKQLDGFVVDIGKIDLKGLTGDEIQEKLTNVFGAVGDKMAEAAIPGLEKFQKVGEGYLQTLVRVASTVETVTGSMDLLGQGGNNAKLGTDGAMNLADQFGSASDFQSAIGSYFEAFYSDAEQTAAKTAQLGKVFGSLGLAMPDSIEGFRKLVEAQDLSTTAGQDTYATLIKLAPAFADLQQGLGNAASAADVLREQQDLQRQLLEAQGDTAAIRELDIKSIDASNQALQRQVWAVTDAKAAADAAAQAEQALASTREGLEGQILQLTGDTAAIRAKELAALDPSLRSLQERIYLLTDEQAATAAANQLAQQRAGLETTLMQLTGDVAGQRAAELAALDPTLRALQLQIYATQDLQAAAEATAQAQADAAQKAAAFAQERGGLEDQIFELEGNTAAQRYKALQALDPANRALQEYIYNLQDQAAATTAAAQAASDAAAKEQAIAQERNGLMSQLWEATGNTAAIRAAQLASLDPSNRALQQQIWAISDAKDAADAAKQLADAWTSIGDSIMDEVKRIRGLTDAGGGNTFASLQGQFNAAVTSARAGDQDAAKSLPDLSKSLLDAAALAATSRQELARVEAQTAASLESVYGMIAGATTASAAATAALTGAGSSSSSTSDAAAWWSTFAAGSDSGGSSKDEATATLLAVKAEIVALRRDNNDGNATLSGRIGNIEKLLDRVTDGGNAMQVAADKPLPTKAA
jgi:hypothetical protein